MAEKGLTRNEMITELTRSPHGDLQAYLPVGLEAAKREPEFLAHLIAWNQTRGQIRDSKCSLPVIALTNDGDAELVSNAYAHMALLDPRNLIRAVRFGKQVNAQVFPGNRDHGRSGLNVVIRYLKHKEQNWPKWERLAVQHRRSLKELYSLVGVKPKPMADLILFKGEAPVGTVFADIRNLKNMGALEAAGVIAERRIPFLIAAGALQERIKEPELLMALIGRMTPTELITNTRTLEKLGVKTDPRLRAAFEEGLKRVAGSQKTTFKASRAAEALEDEGLADKLKGVQEKQIKALGGIDGDWLVLGDKSGSMAACIETARHIAATLAKMVNGKVHLIYFDVTPTYIDATGMGYDKLLSRTKSIKADGGTSIGCGVRYILDKQVNVDGIVIVSDGCENTEPRFAAMYQRLTAKLDKEPPVYFYHVGFQSNNPLGAKVADSELAQFGKSLAQAGIDAQVFELGHNVDYYSLPTLAQTMRVLRYGLADEIMETRLLKLEDVLPIDAEARA